MVLLTIVCARLAFTKAQTPYPREARLTPTTPYPTAYDTTCIPASQRKWSSRCSRDSAITEEPEKGKIQPSARRTGVSSGMRKKPAR